MDWRREGGEVISNARSIFHRPGFCIFRSGLRADRDLAKEMLTLWQDEPDLAGLREPAGLERLTADERKGCLALWAEVGRVLARCGNTP